MCDPLICQSSFITGVAYLDFVVEGAEHACARPQLAKNFAGKGMFLTYNLGDVDAACAEFTRAGYPLAMPIKTETWFERHCYVIDPNGIPLNLAHWNHTPAEPTGKKYPLKATRQSPLTSMLLREIHCKAPILASSFI